MNDQDYIRKAIELADGFDTRGERHLIDLLGVSYTVAGMPQWFKDALAAQLVRQVDELKDERGFTRCLLKIRSDCTDLYHLRPSWAKKDAWRHKGEGRAMNTIKTIINSQTLEEESE